MPKCICSGITPSRRAVKGSWHNPTCGLYADDFPAEPADTLTRLHAQRDEARDKAIDSLGRYKFAMFGYWAGIWVHLNQIIGDRAPSPFKHLVEAAKKGAVNADS